MEVLEQRRAAAYALPLGPERARHLRRVSGAIRNLNLRSERRI